MLEASAVGKELLSSCSVMLVYSQVCVLFILFNWSLVSFTGYELFLLCCCTFGLGINEQNHCQRHEYLTTNNFIIRKLDQLEHALKAAEAPSTVPGHANKYWFNVCQAFAEGLCACKEGEVRRGEAEGFSGVGGGVEERSVESTYPALF